MLDRQAKIKRGTIVTSDLHSGRTIKRSRQTLLQNSEGCTTTDPYVEIAVRDPNSTTRIGKKEIETARKKLEE